MTVRIAAALALLLASPLALSHDTLPNENWCMKGTAVPIGDIAFGGGDTKSYRQCLIREAVRPTGYCRLSTTVVSSKPCPAQTCGEFDDDYRAARQLAQNYCNGLVADPASPYFGMETVPVFSGPASLIDNATHHTTYDVSNGVYGDCMVCIADETDRR
jgi:hypothetical protein